MKAKVVIVNARLIIGILVVLFAAHCVPAANAQTVMIGSSVDHGLPVHPGDTIRAGYQVSIDDDSKSSGATTISVTNAVVVVSIACSKGKGDDNKGDKDDNDRGNKDETITINLSPRTFSVPDNSRNWSSPANDYQGQTTAPAGLCGGKGGTTDGATFRATSSFTCHAKSDEGCCHNVCFRFHVLYNNRGGDFSEKSCKREKECASPEKRGNGHCCDKDKDRD
jgi:hypothetical protein